MRLVLIIHLSRRRPSRSHGLKVCPVSARLPCEPLQSGAAQILSESSPCSATAAVFFFFCRRFRGGLVFAADCQNGRERHVNGRMSHVKKCDTLTRICLHFLTAELVCMRTEESLHRGCQRFRRVDRPLTICNALSVHGAQGHS